MFTLFNLFFSSGFLLIHLIESIVHNFFGHSHSPFAESQQKSLTSLEDAGVKIPRVGLINKGFDSDDLSSKFGVKFQSEIRSDNQTLREASGKEKGVLISVRSFLVVLALSVHSVFEGMAIGEYPRSVRI